MMQTGWSRLRRRVVWAVVALLGAGLLPLYVAAAAQSSVTKLSGFSTARSSVLVGGALWDGVTVAPRAARTVAVQYRRAGTRAFRTGLTVRTSSRGAATLALKPPTAGRWQFRAVVASAGRARRAVSGLRTVVASGLAARTTVRGFSTTPVTRATGQTVTTDVVVKPGPRRVVLVQSHPASSSRFVTQSIGHTTSTGTFHAVYRATTAGLWRVRLVVRASARARGATSATRAVTVVSNQDGTAPGPVTGLTVSSVTNRSATLSWTNPSDADLSGVVIRRAVGKVAPASANAGTAVVDVAAPGRTFNDTGLDAATTYSYAAFAHDPTPNFAAAAAATVTTLAVPDATAPGPVTDLAVTSRTRTAISLSWTNPSAADYAGAVVRRAEGSNAPASVTAGAAVKDVPGFDNVVTDDGLAPDKQYTYAVFAHDGVPNYARAATLTVTTRTAATQAVLTVREIGRPETSMSLLTAGVPFEFDASESVAALAAGGLQGTLTFGDATAAQPFTAGSNGPLDFWTASHSYTTPGDYTVTLNVQDDALGTDAVSKQVTVVAAPTASVSVVTATPRVGSPVRFGLSFDGKGAALKSYELVLRDLDDVTTPDEISPADVALGTPQSPHELTDPPVSTFNFKGDAPPTAKDVTFTGDCDVVRAGEPTTTGCHYEVLFSVTNDAGGTILAKTTVNVLPAQ